MLEEDQAFREERPSDPSFKNQGSLKHVGVKPRPTPGTSSGRAYLLMRGPESFFVWTCRCSEGFYKNPKGASIKPS